MLKFYIKESFRSIFRAKSYFTLALISMITSLLLILSCIVTLTTSAHFQKKLKNDFAVTLFVKDEMNKDEIQQLESELQQLEYVQEVQYTDKETAAKNFIAETGEDFKKILDYNPLPPSFTVKFKENYVEIDSLNKIIPLFSEIGGVEEVVYKQETIKKVLEVISSVKKYLFLITGILVLISMYIVFSTIKLIITLKMEELETMKLVGAKLSAIKIPVLLSSIMIGVMASICTLLLFNLYITYLDRYINILDFFRVDYFLNTMVISVLGPGIGLLVSYISMKKLTLNI